MSVVPLHHLLWRCTLLHNVVLGFSPPSLFIFCWLLFYTSHPATCVSAPKLNSNTCPVLAVQTSIRTSGKCTIQKIGDRKRPARKPPIPKGNGYPNCLSFSRNSDPCFGDTFLEITSTEYQSRQSLPLSQWMTGIFRWPWSFCPCLSSIIAPVCIFIPLFLYCRREK